MEEQNKIPKPSALEKRAFVTAVSFLFTPTVLGVLAGIAYSYFSKDHDYNTYVPLFSGAFSVAGGISAKLILDPPRKKYPSGKEK